jgi:hypothetical protein
LSSLDEVSVLFFEAPALASVGLSASKNAPTATHEVSTGIAVPVGDKASIVEQKIVRP